MATGCHRTLFHALVVATALCFALAHARLHFEHQPVRRHRHRHDAIDRRHHAIENRAAARQPKAVLTSWNQAREVVDYIIVGGGTAGLTLAGRLSEDKDVTILVIEAGHSGYAQEDQIRQPNAIDYDSLTDSDLDWAFNTTSQTNLDNRQIPFAAYRTFGGSSAGNSLVYTRHSTREGQVAGRYSRELHRDGWGWHDVQRAMDDAVHFDAPDGDGFSSSAKVANETLARGGPVFLSYPANHRHVEDAWLASFREIGVQSAKSPYQGQTVGAFVAPTTIEKLHKHRSFSRSAYYDPIADKRSNLQVLPDQTVTRVIFDDAGHDGKRRALGVEYAANKTAPRVHVTAKREVILSAGVIGSPQILQLSGVGAKGLLESRKIKVIKDLPGVGQHLQDASYVSIQFKPKHGFALPSSTNKPDYVDSAVSYLTLEDLVGSDAKANEFLARADKRTIHYSSKEDTAAVRQGRNKTLTSLTQDLLHAKSASGFTGDAKPAVKLSLSTTGDQVSLTAWVQGIFSRGSVQILSGDAFQYPGIDGGYLSHDADRELLLAGLGYARKLAATKSFGELVDSEHEDTQKLKSEADLSAWVNKTAFNFRTTDLGRAGHHASSTCSMLSEADGGVVDSDLKVWGFSNLRVVDASIIPISPSSGLVSHVYGIAEIAARKIKEDRRAGSAEPLEECEYEEEKGEAHADQHVDEDCEEEEEHEHKTQEEEGEGEEECDES